MISFRYKMFSHFITSNLSIFANKSLHFPSSKLDLLRLFSLTNVRNETSKKFDNSFEALYDFEFQKQKPKTSKEVEERLIAILYKFDKRKDFLHNIGTQMHYDMGMRMSDIDEFLDFVEDELEINMHKGHFMDFKILLDIHNYVCNELCIPIDRKTIRQQKLEKKKELEKEIAKIKNEQCN